MCYSIGSGIGWDTLALSSQLDLDLDLTSSKQFITYLITGGKAGDLQMYLCPHFWLLSNATNLIGPAPLGRIWIAVL